MTFASTKTRIAVSTVLTVVAALTGCAHRGRPTPTHTQPQSSAPASNQAGGFALTEQDMRTFDRIRVAVRSGTPRAVPRIMVEDAMTPERLQEALSVISLCLADLQSADALTRVSQTVGADPQILSRLRATREEVRIESSTRFQQGTYQQNLVLAQRYRNQLSELFRTWIQASLAGGP